MAVLDLATAKQRLSEWLDADSKVASGQAYSIGGRSLTRTDAAEISRKITYWQEWVKKLDRGGIRTRRGVPL